MIILLLVIPIIGSLILFSISPRIPLARPYGIGQGIERDNLILVKNRLKKIALATSLLNLIISILLWIEFDSNSSEFQFVYEFNIPLSFGTNFCHFNVGIDGTSLFFVLLTTFITPFCILSHWDDKNISYQAKLSPQSLSITNISVGKSLTRQNNVNSLKLSTEFRESVKEKGVITLKYFLISFLILETLQIFVFVVLDLLLFYIFFESILPILFIMIVIFGSGENKIRSANLFFLYTLAGSLPMLLSILVIYYNLGSTDYQLISLSEISLENQKILFLGFFIAFAVKTPLWPVYLWLPKAHSDSPLAGSILLAGTVLKLAPYGFLRILVNIFPDATNYFQPMIQTIAIISIVYASLATIRQNDTKALIAYSSICHMGVVVLGIFSNTIQGIEGAILLALGHGFVSPALFICVGGVIYNRTHSRIILYHRGLAYYMPMFTILFFLFTLCNTGIPLSLNFLGEQLSLIGIWERNPFVAILGASGIVFSACYSIFLYNRMSYGAYSPHLLPIKDVTRLEFFTLLSLLIPTVILGIFPNFILDSLHLSISLLLFNIPFNP